MHFAPLFARAISLHDTSRQCGHHGLLLAFCKYIWWETVKQETWLNKVSGSVQRPHRVWTEAIEQVNAINHCSVTSEQSKLLSHYQEPPHRCLELHLNAWLQASAVFTQTDGVSLVNKGLTPSTGHGHKRCIYGSNANVKGTVVLIYSGPVASLWCIA